MADTRLSPAEQQQQQQQEEMETTATASDLCNSSSNNEDRSSSRRVPPRERHKKPTTRQSPSHQHSGTTTKCNKCGLSSSASVDNEAMCNSSDVTIIRKDDNNKLCISDSAVVIYDNNNDNNSETTVVDAAAAAVAVSAIPETMKELHINKCQSDNIDNNSEIVVERLNGQYKGQIRSADDNLVGPCGKKRCADRYDSSESSDSGVAVSCGECSSSGTSDITEPGSPCSTSSDEGVGVRGKTPSPLPTVPKLAPPNPTAHNGTRPPWPWTPPLAATACSTYKRLKVEPESGTLPRLGAAETSPRATKVIQLGKQVVDNQGKITEYFKTQIKPQQLKTKKSEMSVMVAKTTPEFRRPPTVQRNKVGLAKYLGVTTPNDRITNWEVRTMTVTSPTGKKLPTAASPRVTATKIDKKLTAKATTTTIPDLPISSDVLTSLPSCKISSLRLTSEARPSSSPSPPQQQQQQQQQPQPQQQQQQQQPTEDSPLTDTIKPIVNENNNVCSNDHTINKEHPLSRIIETKDDKDEIRTRLRIDNDNKEVEKVDFIRPKPPTSPILSAPTTIRFPAKAPAKSANQTESGLCRWVKCNADFECSGELLEHLQNAHINTQTGGDNFICHWEGCKVQGRASCSRRWLERHVLSHGGNKPFRCIVDGCGSRFSSQPALERHVNNHFNQPEPKANSKKADNGENGGKLVRRNGKKLRYRRQPWSARIFDYFDSGIMEGLQHRLLELAESRTQGLLAETPGNAMTLTSQVLARRIEKDGKIKVLVRWHPQDIEPDEWILESDVQRIKHIPVRQAATTSIDQVSLVLHPALGSGPPPTTRVKQLRKPRKNS